MGKLIINRYFFTLFYVSIVIFLYYYFFDDVIKIIQNIQFRTIASVNIGLFASLTGFLIAAIPFFLNIILKKDYLIKAVGNNLDEITSALFVLIIIFTVSIFILLFDISNKNCIFIIWSLFIYLYVFLIYYVIEIIMIIEQLVSDLKYLKKEIDNEDQAIDVLNKILKEIKSKNNHD